MNTNIIERLSATALGGALVYESGAWHWSDGTPAPEVRPLRLRDCAPSFRISAGHVEIPKAWHEPRYWPGGQVDTDAMRAIETLLHQRPAEMIFNEGGTDYQDHHPGYRIPLAEWYAAMGLVIGAQWDSVNEAAILAKADTLHAKALGAKGGRAGTAAQNAARKRNAQHAGRKTARTRLYGVCARPGYFDTVTHVLSAHTTKGAAVRAMGRGYTDASGSAKLPLCVVYQESGFCKGMSVYSDMFPQIVE